MQLSRRQFMKSTLVTSGALAFPNIIPARVLGADAPSKKVNILQIGCGRIGRSMDMPGILKQDAARMIAVCDLDSIRVADAKKCVEEFYAKKNITIDVATYGDYHEALQRKDIDAVAISTPDHWHAQPVIEAVLAGKDIYVQKPLTMTLVEGRAVSDIVRKNKRMFQIGSQQRSNPGFRMACEAVRNGRIGKVHTVKVARRGYRRGGRPSRAALPRRSAAPRRGPATSTNSLPKTSGPSPIAQRELWSAAMHRRFVNTSICVAPCPSSPLNLLAPPPWPIRKRRCIAALQRCHFFHRDVAAARRIFIVNSPSGIDCAETPIRYHKLRLPMAARHGNRRYIAIPMADFNSLQSRSQWADAISDGFLDVLIIGGGIVGAGVARDAAMRGLSVGLVEQHDFASGTSSRTTRLLHGGLRYLAQGRLGLVYQASHEKRVVQRIAPHLADPLAFVFPTYRGGEWPLWKLRIGVKLYDWLCGGQNLGRSSSLDRKAVADLLPGLAHESLTGAVRYFDGMTSDARLVFDTFRSAAAHGAQVANYTRLEEASPTSGGWMSQVHDVRTNRMLRVRSRAIVNATGPWAPSVSHSRIRLRLTKGVHLVIDRRRLDVRNAVVVYEGSRLLFAIPWDERVILGTTDTDYDGSPEAVCTDPADIEHVLRIINRSFPAARLEPADVLSTWAGVRPLLASRHGGPSDISRAHLIAMAEPGWFDVAGGKLTTYRLIAEETVDQIAKFLDRPLKPCRTAEEPLLNVDEVPVASAIIPPEPNAALVRHYCTREWAVHLDDVMIRRTSWHHYLANRQESAARVAEWMAETLGWDSDRLATERARYDAVAF